MVKVFHVTTPNILYIFMQLPITVISVSPWSWCLIGNLKPQNL